MINKRHSQTGSTALIITIILTLAIAGSVGFVWWQRANERSTQVNTQQSSTQKEAEADKATSQKAAQQDEYLVINEWGVRLKTSIADHLTYQPRSLTNTGSPTPFDELGLRIKPTSVINQGCVNFGADLYRQLTPSDRFETKKIGDYYYFVTGAPGECSDEPSDAQLQKNVLIDLNVANLEAL